MNKINMVSMVKLLYDLYYTYSTHAMDWEDARDVFDVPMQQTTERPWFAKLFANISFMETLRVFYVSSWFCYNWFQIEMHIQTFQFTAHNIHTLLGKENLLI